jgi:ATP phosphoribosyltransferase
MNEQIEKLINSTVEILDRDPLSQSEDTYSILLKFTQALATELGEIVVASRYNEGTRMYFDEKIARYEIKNAVGLINKDY